MAYMCLECYEVYNMNLPYCPKETCNCGQVIEVDELMLPTIMILNQKGYCTEFCCSGHAYHGYCNSYITFNSFLTEMLKECKFNEKELFKRLPEPWHIENRDAFNRLTLRCRINKTNMVTIQKEICDANMKLLDFVNELPSLFDDEV